MGKKMQWLEKKIYIKKGITKKIKKGITVKEKLKKI